MLALIIAKIVELFVEDLLKSGMRVKESFGKVVLIFIMSMLPVFVSAQTKAPKPPTKKEQEKKAAQKEKDAQKADEKAKKEYRKMQSKKTRKSMKQNKKRSDRNRKSKGAPFWEKWFKRR
ncbi:hypothetical protein KFE94_09950 [bacterium SCSIO 12643]|nr:hypothetical protein KFE94_09950 [bacterium SCSIO 12643]